VRRSTAGLGAILALTLAACGGGTSTTSASTQQGSAASSGSGPQVGDHWHAAYGIYSCDHFLTPLQNVTDVDGVHTHGDGIIHVHPFNSNATGSNANLATFAKAAGLTITDTEISSPELTALKAGDDCHGQPVHLEVAVWDAPGAATPRIVTSGLAKVAITHDREVITIAAVPVGVAVPQPTWTQNLDALGDVAVTTTAPPPAETISGVTACPKTDGSSSRVVRFAQPPPQCIDPTHHYRAAITTTVGAFTVDLDPAAAPNGVNVFVTLARYHTYDGTVLWHIVPGLAFYGGDPVGVPAGTGGPGFSFPAEHPSSTSVYRRGAFGLYPDDKGAVGSQFYAITAADVSSQLTSPSLPVIGTWSDPSATMAKIEARGTSSGNVFDPVTVTSVTITES